MKKLFSYVMLAFIGFVTYLSAESVPAESIPNEYKKSFNSQSLKCRMEVLEKMQNHFIDLRNQIQALVHSNSKVMDRYDSFANSLLNMYAEGHGVVEVDIYQISSSLLFAAKKHQYQTRKDPEATPYIIHPMGVAEQLIEIGHVSDPDIIMGALLHDTVEDTETSFEEINQHFGERVKLFVRELTDDKSLPKAERKRMQIVNASHKSAGAAMIKLSDKLYNLNDLQKNPPADWAKERIDQYFQWAEEVVNKLPWVNSDLKNAVDKIISSYKNG